MAFTKIVGAGIHTLSNVHTHNINSSGIITATNFVGPFDGTTGDFSGNVTIGGNLIVNGDTTTLNTTLREVELLRVDAQNDNVAAGIITQRGTGDILNLYDGATKVVTVKDGGDVIAGVGDLATHTGSRRRLAITDTNNGALLHIRGQSPAVFFDQSGGNIGKIYQDNADLGIYAGRPDSEGANTVRITSAGKVGINKSDPDALLHIHNSGTTQLPFKVYRNDVGDVPVVHFQAYSNTVGVVDKFVVTARGRVGVNTDNPQRELHVKPSDNNPATAVPGYIRIDSQGSNQPAVLELYHTRGNAADKWPSSVASVDGGLSLNTANGNNGAPQEKVRINQNGLGIHTSNPLSGLHISDGTAYGSPQNSSRKATLTISAGSEGSSDIQLLSAHYNHIFFGDSTDPNTGIIWYQHTGSGTDSMHFSTAGTEKLAITSGGSVNIGGDYTQTSSKLKVTGTVTVDGGFALSAGSFTAPGGFSINSGNVIMHQYIAHDADPDSFFGFPAANRFKLELGGKKTLEVRADGNVGFGTDNPQADFEIFGHSSAANGPAPVFAIRNGYSGTANQSNALKNEIRFLHKNHNAAHEFMAARIIADTTDNYMQRTFLRFLVANANNGTERLTISPYGRVGINSTTPSHDLDVVSSSNAYIKILKSGSNPVYIGNADGEGVIETTTATFFKTGGYERLRLDSTGHLSIKGTDHHVRWYRDDGARYGAIFYDGGQFTLQNPTNDNFQITKSDGTVLYKFMNSGKMGIGIASPDSMLHIHTDSAGTVTADADADELVLESDGNTGLSILSPGSGESSIYFGNPGTNGQKDGWIKYYHETHSTTADRRSLVFRSSGGERLRITGSGDVTTTGTATFNRQNAGFTARAGDSVSITRANGTPLELNRTGSDGQMIALIDDNSVEASIGLTSGNLFFGVPNSSNPKFTITTDGDVAITTRGSVEGVSKLNVEIPSRTTTFSASDGDTWHDVLIENPGGADDNAVGLCFQVTGDTYHKNAGTGIAAVKNGTNSDYGADLVFITRPQNAVAEERLRIKSDGDILINQPPEASGRLTIRGSGAYTVGNSGKALEGLDIQPPTVGNNNYGGAISLGCGGNGRSAIAAIQEGSDDDKNGLSFFTHNTNVGSDNTVEKLRITSLGIIQHFATGGDNQFITKRTGNAGSNGNYFFHLIAKNNNDDQVGNLGFYRDTANDDARFSIKTKVSGGNNTERFQIDSLGRASFSKNGWVGNDMSFALTVHTGSTSDSNNAVNDGIMIVSQNNNGNQNSTTGKVMWCGHAQTNGPFIYAKNAQAYGKKDLVINTHSTANDYTTQLEETARFSYGGAFRVNRIEPLAGLVSGQMGGVIQVKWSANVDNANYSSTSDVVMQTVNITPTNNSARILIHVCYPSIRSYITGNTRHRLNHHITRDGAEIYSLPEMPQWRGANFGSSGVEINKNVAFTYIDSPNTTNQVTYRATWQSADGHVWNTANAQMVMICVELTGY